MALDYYKILEISPNATLQEIKRAYRRLARRYHPDLNSQDPTAREKFQAIAAAYDVLRDTKQRAEYDQQFHSNVSDSPSLTGRDYYEMGLKKMKLRQYMAAVKCYSQAITLQPDFVEAYLQRCEAYFYLRFYPEVLEDCYQILIRDHQQWQAYYYQGRVRQKLGYLQAAIEAYTQAIIISSQQANLYYYRGLANQELNRKKLARQDFTTAANLYQKQNNKYGYSKVLRQQRRLEPIGFIREIIGFSEFLKLLKLIIITIFQVASNPSGELLPIFSQLNLEQKISIGCFYGLMAEIILVVMLPDTQLLGLLIWVLLTVVFLLINCQTYCRFNFLATIFLSGLTSLALSFLLLVYAYLSYFPHQIMGIILLIYLSTISFLTIYVGLTQLFNISEQKSTCLMPVIMLSLWSLIKLSIEQDAL
ncbi:MAG: DnaJ domain-containing protein [Microcystaceae cyanobacterium]